MPNKMRKMSETERNVKTKPIPEHYNIKKLNNVINSIECSVAFSFLRYALILSCCSLKWFAALYWMFSVYDKMAIYVGTWMVCVWVSSIFFAISFNKNRKQQPQYKKKKQTRGIHNHRLPFDMLLNAWNNFDLFKCSSCRYIVFNSSFTPLSIQ